MAIMRGFPASTTLTPANCCSPTCPADDPAWDQQGWRDVRCSPTQATQYRYQLTSSGEGSDARFTVRAVYGCPESDVWEITVRVGQNGSAIMDEMRHVR